MLPFIFLPSFLLSSLLPSPVDARLLSTFWALGHNLSFSFWLWVHHAFLNLSRFLTFLIKFYVQNVIQNFHESLEKRKGEGSLASVLRVFVFSLWTTWNPCLPFLVPKWPSIESLYLAKICFFILPRLYSFLAVVLANLPNLVHSLQIWWAHCRFLHLNHQ